MTISRRRTIGTLCDEIARQGKAGESAIRKAAKKPAIKTAPPSPSFPAPSPPSPIRPSLDPSSKPRTVSKAKKRKVVKPKVSIVRASSPRTRPAPPPFGGVEKLDKEVVVSAGDRQFRSRPQTVQEARLASADIKKWIAYASSLSKDQEAEKTIEVSGTSIELNINGDTGVIGGFRDPRDAESAYKDLLAVLRVARHRSISDWISSTY